jgi:hypothetical protein
VALLDAAGKPVLLIEVWHTHAVDDDKRADLAPYWWIEVEAAAVLAETKQLVVRKFGNLPAQLALTWAQAVLFAMR